MRKQMTMDDFNKIIEEQKEKYPIFKLSKQLSINELTWLLRQQEQDFGIWIEEENSLIPSAKETFINSRILAKKIRKIDLEDDRGLEYPTLIINVF